VSDYDIAIIGGGISGFSAACLLAEERGDGSRIALIERESQPGYHTTGRSAAMYTEVYGNQTIRSIVRAGRKFLEEPDTRYHDRSFLSGRGALMVASGHDESRVDRFLKEMNRPDVLARSSVADCLKLSPALNPEKISGGVWEPSAMDIDVHALLQAYIRVYRGLNGNVYQDAEVRNIERTGDRFGIETTSETINAGIVINAAGAWGDEVARMAGAEPVGLVPKRRTALTFDPPTDMDHRSWPLSCDMDEQWYFKPDAGRVMASPADQTPSPACDAQPDEMDLAICVDRIQTMTSLEIRRMASTWAGLRCFVGDHSPVNGFDDKVEGFYWLVGQGGYGIKTSCGMARIAVARITGREIDDDFYEYGLDPAAIAVERLRNGDTA
jgi:D-arginine dehydrogenase